MREVDKAMVLRLVAENAKQRFELLYGFDPSPPPPKKGKKGQTPKGHGKKPKPSSVDPSGGGALANDEGELDAGQVEDAARELAKAKITPAAPEAASAPAAIELPLVALPAPSGDPAEPPSMSGEEGEYFIRASQGHSLKLESVAHLEEIKDDEEGRLKAGEMVHGTRWELWAVLSEWLSALHNVLRRQGAESQGLSRMDRQHIHLAPALSNHRITPRPTSTLLIYLDLAKLLAAGIPVYSSANGVVLTPGNTDGFVSNEFWCKAERVPDGLRNGGKRLVVWINGKEVCGEGAEEEEAA
jgi:2'-phosphotransferase